MQTLTTTRTGAYAYPRCKEDYLATCARTRFPAGEGPGPGGVATVDRRTSATMASVALYCTVCGSTTSVGYKFCRECGASTEGAAPQGIILELRGWFAHAT